MKIDNYLWGCKRIHDELDKISMEYYNGYHPHQGLGAIPEGRPPDASGTIKKKPILYGLYNHYFRAS